MKAVNFLRLDFFKMVSLGCLSTSFDYHRQLVTMTLLPIGICIALKGVAVLRPCQRGLMELIMLVLIYSVMPSVSTTVFGAFSCDYLKDTGESYSDGGYLIADYSIDCGTKEYALYATYSGVMVVVYPIGIPLVFALLLFRKRARIKSSVEEREKVRLDRRKGGSGGKKRR